MKVCDGQHRQSQRGETLVGWLITLVLSAGMVGGAWHWRQQRMAAPVVPPHNPDTPAGEVLLPRTTALTKQKIDALTAYNKEMTQQELLEFFQRASEGRPVLASAFEELDARLTRQVLPKIWRMAQERSELTHYVSLKAMSEAIRELFPQYTLPNADVVLFPEDPKWRSPIAETPRDYVNDTAWHWRWMALTMERASLEERRRMRELDIYAAEELSEFISLLAVAVIDYAHRFHLDADSPFGSRPVDAELVARIFNMLEQHQKTMVPTPPEHRPVLFSALVKQRVLEGIPKPMFVDASKAWGLDYVHQPNAELNLLRARLEVPTGIEGGGVAAGDFNGDGFVDLYLAGDGGGRLYRNDGGKKLVDITDAAGLLREGETRAGYFVDYDNDGDLDLFQTCVWLPLRLYRNEGNGKFTDVSAETKLATDKAIRHEAVWFDFDNDGLLDVYVANFGTWPEGASPTLGRHNDSAPPNQLFHHRVENGKHYFVDIAAAAGVADRGWTHCVGAWDYDQDGYTDLFSLNDFGVSKVFHNIGGRKFEEVSRQLHLDATYNAMNFHLLDLDRSGHPAIYVTQIHKLTHRERYRKPEEGTKLRFENLGNLRALVANTLYQRRPDGTYANVHDIYIEPADLGWAWDASTFDYENDGDEELLVLNGTEDKSKIPTIPNEQRPSFKGGRDFLSKYDGQTNVCFFSEGRYFYDVSKESPLCYPSNARGSAMFDFDNDGDIDVLITEYNGPARIFENKQPGVNQWLRLKLQGTRSNRDAVGARVELRASGQKFFTQVVSRKGFLSQNPHALHFGLGAAQQADQVIITWPSGEKQTLGPLPAGQLHLIREPAAAAP